jgi:uncharacterized protein
VRALFDVNVLIALIDEQHIHHQAAHAWWSAHRADGWASCPLTQNGFVRIVSQPRYPNPLTVAAAHALLERQVASAEHAFWSDDVSLLDETRFDRDHMLGPKQLTDIYLLGLAVHRDGRLVTIDGSIPLGAVRGAEPRHLVAIGVPEARR